MLEKNSSAVKQVLVIRKDLGMRKGKMVAQGSHASLAVLLEMMRGGASHLDYRPEIVYDQYQMPLNVAVDSPLDVWLRGSFTKICLYVESEEELVQLYEKAKSVGLPASLIIDKGLTEFGGVPTKTCMAIGPAVSEEIDAITGNLKLL